MPPILRWVLFSRRGRRLARRLVRFPPTRSLIARIIVRMGVNAALERAHEAAPPILDVEPVHRLERRALRSRPGRRLRRRSRRFVSRLLRRF